mgnify:CR=1 FL=1
MVVVPAAAAVQIEPIMEERKHLNISIQTNLPHDTYHTKSSISYIKVRAPSRSAASHARVPLPELAIPPVCVSTRALARAT